MNLDFFTTALFATGATGNSTTNAAMSAEQSNELAAENLQNTYEKMSDHRQRRFRERFSYES